MTATGNRVLGDDPAQLREIVERLAACRYFQTMAPDVLTRVVQGGTVESVPADTVLIREGDQDDFFYVLLEGQLSVRSRGTVILTLQTPGDIIGEMAIISAAPRSADVLADEASRLVRVSFSALRADAADPEQVSGLYEAFSHIMAAKLAETSNRARQYEEAVMAARELAKGHSALESEIEDKLQEIAVYSRVIENSNDAVLITDLQGVVQRYNPAARKLFPILDKSEDWHPSMVELADDLERGGFPEPAPKAFWQGEWSRADAEEPFVLQVTVIPIGQEDAVSGLAFQCRDITLQKANERMLERTVAERTHQVRRLLDHMDEGMLTVAADGRIHPGCSAATARLIGDAPEGADLAERLRLEPAAAESLRATLALLLNPDLKVDWEDLVRLLPAEFEPQPGRWVSAHFLPVRESPGGPVERVMVILHDVSGAKALAQDVALAQARQERIVSILQDWENFELFRGDAQRLLAEARETVGALESNKRGAVDALFRTLHTLKGTGALFGLRDFAQQAHACEDQLRALRENRDDPVSDERRTALLDGIGTLERLLQEAWDEVRILVGQTDEGGRSVRLAESRLLAICEAALALVPAEAAAAVREELERLRRVPAARLLRRYRGVVERIANRLGKLVQLRIQDSDACELPPEFFQQVDPALLHLLRNAVDHGVEMPEERESAGKQPQASIALAAQVQDGRVEFTVTDDGRGIDPQRILELGLQRGLVKPEKAPQLAERDILQLLFIPGFSSASAVTDLSGRGVGLDVVKTEVERLGGKVGLASRVGRGTTFRLVYTRERAFHAEPPAPAAD